MYAAARAVAADDETAAQVTVRALRAAQPEAAAAQLAAGRRPHPAYAAMAPADRDAVVLARVLGWTSDRIAAQLRTSEADVRARLARGPFFYVRSPRRIRRCSAPGRLFAEHTPAGQRAA